MDPLSDESIGATTGFRWYLPIDGGFWSHIEAAWNASGTNLLFNDKYNFPWGGAMALRSETLDKVGIREVWAKAVSDDMTLNSALRAHGYQVAFLPQCMVATFNKTTRDPYAGMGHAPDCNYESLQLRALAVRVSSIPVL